MSRGASVLAALLLASAPAAVARAQDAGSDATLLAGSGGDVSLRTTAQTADGKPQVAGALSYVARPAQAVTARVDVDVKSGQASDGVLWPGASADVTRPYTDVGLGVSADWAVRSDASLKLTATDRRVTRPVTAETLSPEADAPRDERTEQGAAFAGALPAPAGVKLRLGGEVSTSSDVIDISADADDRARLRSRDAGVHADLDWAVLPILKLQAGGRLASTATAWAETDSAARSFESVQPDATATLTPWSGGALALGVARAVTPLDAAKFVTLARVSAAAADSDLRPDQEWRMQATVSQALPLAGQLDLGLTQARLESSTELMRVGVDTEAPGSVQGGRRQEVDMHVALPLSPLGLRSVRVETQGVWRDSRITDPVTGEVRRLSGESPFETRVALVQTLGKRGLTWGVDTHDQGDQSYYGLNELSSVTTDRSLGAFVEYRPADYAVRLQLDNLAGGERRWTDAYYVDGRDTGDVQRLDRHSDGGPAFTLSLHRAL